MELVTVFTVFSPIETQFIRSRFEAAEFYPFVADEFSTLGTDGHSLADAKEFPNAPTE